MKIILRAFMALCSVGLATSTLSAAQDSEPLAPRVERDSGAIDIRLVVAGYGNETGFDRPLRDAEALVDPKTWITERSALYRAHTASPEDWRSGSVEFRIDIEGVVTECQTRGFDRLPVGETELCKEFSGQRFLPALSREGERIASSYRLYISKYVVAAEAGSPRRVLVDPAPPPPVVVAPPAPLSTPTLRLTQFPPYGRWLRLFYREPEAWALAPLRGAEAVSPDVDTVGIVLSSSGTDIDCHVPKSSGDPRFGSAACEFGRTALKPVWGDATSRDPRAIPLLVVRNGDTFTAYGPIEKPRATAEFADGNEDVLVTALANGGVFPRGRSDSPLELTLIANADGTLQSCDIDRSTGYDALDIDACTIAETVVRLRPHQDLFGQPKGRSYLFWRAAPSERDNSL